MNKNPFIGIAGNIGVGKTTMTEKISQRLNWNPIYESVIDNPYLEDFFFSIIESDLFLISIYNFGLTLYAFLQEQSCLCFV